MSLSVRRAALAIVAAAAAVTAAARPAAAHPLDIGYLRLDSRGEALTATLDIDAGAAADLLGVPGRPLGPAAIAARAAELADQTLRRAPIDTDRGPCRWTTATAGQQGTTATLTVAADCPSGFRTIRWPLPFIAGPGVSAVFQLFVKAQLGGEESVTTLDRGAPELAVSAAARIGFTEFVWSGIEHIGAAPGQWRTSDGGWKLPDGLDHILFLLALLLGGGGLWRLAGIATGFTAGHSITLALSGLGLVRPSPRVIEPLIALSIAWVAAQTLIRPRDDAGGHRWKIAAAFGLIHGFGFAGALGGLDLAPGDLVVALLGFNAGIELGQIAIVLALTPALLLLGRAPDRHRVVVRALAAAICAAGLYWFVVRLIG